MTDYYLGSLLVAGGVCVGFGLHATSLAIQTRLRRYVYLMLLALLEAAYCLFAWRYLSLTDGAVARPWGQAFCAFMPYMTFLFGELTMDLTKHRPRWIVVLQRVNIVVTTAFASGVVLDVVLKTSLMLTPEIRTDLTTLHRHLLVFTPLGLAYLCWVTIAFGCFAVVLVKGYRSRRNLLPMVLGCLVYFLATIVDFGIVVGIRDGIFLQHFGFFVLVIGSWRVLSHALSDARAEFSRLEEQRNRLLTTTPRPRSEQLGALGTMAAGVAHEINNPVHGIMNYATLLKRHVDPTSAASGVVDEIASASKQVADIVKNLVLFSRGDAMPTVAADMKHIVDGTLALMRSALAEDDIALRVRIEDALPEITCRTAQLQQVLVNLVTNAREALVTRDPARMDDKMITVDVSQYTHAGEPWVVLEIADNGDGFARALSERIFDPFFTTKAPSGMGLGLSISHGIVQSHGGRITATSGSGRGAQFRVEIPCQPPLDHPTFADRYLPSGDRDSAVD